jgi:2-polyprenyl-3-methyl-5-hydroxy-6-metoxy-1,4-benzoquinol methylase
MRRLLRATDHREGFGGAFEILQCAGCGHGVTTPVPDDLAACYPTAYQQHIDGRGLRARVVAASVRHTARARWGSAAIERFVPDAALGGPIAPAGRVLDVGAGNGAFVRALRGIGVDAHGVEPNAHAVAAAHHAGSDTVVLGALEDATLPFDAWDLIRIHHVLEHVPDPIATLRTARNLLSGSGRMVVVVPNLGGIGRRLFGASWDGLELPRHLHHFTRSSLASAIARVELTTHTTRTVAVFGCLGGSLDACVHHGQRHRGWGRSLPVEGPLYPIELAAGVLGCGDGLLAVVARAQ